MILLLFLFSYDSLPPLPDLSQILFPEPPLWIEQVENSVMLSGCAGNFYSGKGRLLIQHLNISALYEQKVDWDTLKKGTIRASYSVPLPHLWIKPSLYSYLLRRNDKYLLLSPRLDFSSTISWAVIFGSVRTDLWQINSIHYNEEEIKLEIIFDRTLYLPHFELSGIYTDNQLKPRFTGKLHIRNFHLAIGSPIFRSFPSPHFTLQYLEPKLKLETIVKSGTIHRTLNDFFDPEMPLQYKVPVAEESLKVGVDFDFKLDLYNHFCGLHSAYKNWNMRLIPGEAYEITTINNIQEVNIDFVLKNKFPYELLIIRNALYLHYNWADTDIALQPRFFFLDTLDVHLYPLQISVGAKYISKREGLNKKLSPVVVINSTLGFNYKFWKIFLSIYNITNERKEIFDDYFLSSRQYGGGLEFNYKF